MANTPVCDFPARKEGHGLWEARNGLYAFASSGSAAGMVKPIFERHCAAVDGSAILRKLVALSAPVAQLDRASDYGSEGLKFESSRVRIPSTAPDEEASADDSGGSGAGADEIKQSRVNFMSLCGYSNLHGCGGVKCK